jgi:hypothetical protein
VNFPRGAIELIEEAARKHKYGVAYPAMTAMEKRQISNATERRHVHGSIWTKRFVRCDYRRNIGGHQHPMNNESRFFLSVISSQFNIQTCLSARFAANT